MNFTSKITLLDQLKKRYQLNPKFFKMVRRSLIKEDYILDLDNFKPMFNKFPKYLRKELKYKMYLKMFGNFRILLQLEKSALNKIGDSIKKMHLLESKYNKTKPYIKKTTLLKKYIF